MATLQRTNIKPAAAAAAATLPRDISGVFPATPDSCTSRTVVTGSVQFCCAIAIIVVAIPQLFYTKSSFWGLSIFYICNGAFICIPTGILGCCIGKNTSALAPSCCSTCTSLTNCLGSNSDGKIKSYMVMSIISAVCGGVMMVMGIITTDRAHGQPMEENYQHVMMASQSIVAAVGLTEMVAAIVATAYSCGGNCCASVQLPPLDVEGLNTLTRHLDSKDKEPTRNDDGYAAVMLPGCVSTLGRLNKPAPNDKIDHTYFEAYE